jgi:hypothetical protein
MFWVDCKAMRRKRKPTIGVWQLPIGLMFDYFIEILKPEPRYYALFWEPSVRATLAYDGCAFEKRQAAHIFARLLSCELLRQWLEEHRINFGSACSAPQHWLVSDCRDKTAYAAPVEIARQWVERQRKPRRPV